MTTARLFLPTESGYEQEILGLRQLLRSGELQAAGAQAQQSVEQAVESILTRVRCGGDRAAAELASELDRADLSATTLRVPEGVLRSAHEQLEPSFLQLVRRAVKNIREYQEHIRLRAPAPLVRGGRKLGVRYTALDRVAVYVPGGQALYPSTVLMTVVPAQVAGVQQVVMLSPPTGGEIASLALGLAWELGVKEVYRLGGAVGVAAVAYGTETIPAVDKVVGPGNAYVAEAKRQLFGRVGIDSIAGPSEVFIVADDSANPAWVAADMLAQAEHNPGSAVLATPSEPLARAVLSEITSQLERLERVDALRHALERYAGVIVSRDLEHACHLANEFATEHLQVITRNDDWCLERIRHAGAIFVGAHTPVPLGDYFAGPSHVLPTGGTARFSSPLSCNDFLKSSSVLQYGAADLEQDAGDVMDFAKREGLTAHAAAVRARFS